LCSDDLTLTLLHDVIEAAANACALSTDVETACRAALDGALHLLRTVAEHGERRGNGQRGASPR
jgi:hypothetical protein